MITLNIISQELKKEIKLKAIFQLLKKLLSILIIIISIYAIVILIAKLILQIHFVRTIQETTLVTKSTENYGKKVKDIDKQLNYIDKIQNEAINWSYLVEYIAQNTKDDIKFSQIKLDKENETVYLQGKADTRENLLLLKETLDNSTYFSDIEFPIQNLLEKNDINFDITAKLKSYEFELF